MARRGDVSREACCTRYQRQAEALERAEQWRRAERLWLAAYDSTQDIGLRDAFCRRRDACVQQLNARRSRRQPRS